VRTVSGLEIEKVELLDDRMESGSVSFVAAERAVLWAELME
jgi:hypothetical protein